MCIKCRKGLCGGTQNETCFFTSPHLVLVSDSNFSSNSQKLTTFTWTHKLQSINFITLFWYIVDNKQSKYQFDCNKLSHQMLNQSQSNWQTHPEHAKYDIHITHIFFGRIIYPTTWNSYFPWQLTICSSSMYFSIDDMFNQRNKPIRIHRQCFSWIINKHIR